MSPSRSQKHGKTVAVPVPPSDLDALEDRLDLLDALDALADYRAHGGVPFEDLKADLLTVAQRSDVYERLRRRLAR